MAEKGMLDADDELAKLLAMASSDNDAEAIAAVRAAGKLLKSHGRDWHDVIGKPPGRGLAASFDDVFVDIF